MKLIPMIAVIAGAGLVLPDLASADGGERSVARLSGAQEVVFDQGVFVPGGRATDAAGRIVARFDAALSKVTVNLRIDNLTGSFAAAHFHCGRAGENGPVVFGLVNPGPLSFDGHRIRGTLTNADFSGADCTPIIGRPVNNIAALKFAILEGLIYVNVHSTVFPPGEIRGQAQSRTKGSRHDDHDHD